MAEDSDDTEAVLQAQVVVLDQEIEQLRRRLADAPKRQRALEERLLETKGQLAQAVSQNEKLSYTLREAREHIASLLFPTLAILFLPVGLLGPKIYSWMTAANPAARKAWAWLSPKQAVE